MNECPNFPSGKRRGGTWVTPDMTLTWVSQFPPCSLLHRHQRPVEKQTGKNAQLWKREKIFATLARRPTVAGGQIWCQGATADTVLSLSLSLSLSRSLSLSLSPSPSLSLSSFLSSLPIISSNHQTHHALTVISPCRSQNQHGSPQTQSSGDPRLPEVVLQWWTFQLKSHLFYAGARDEKRLRNSTIA